MGFYGNITNSSKTTFSFDKTYPNRYEADLGCHNDGIMAGRYILIEYDHERSGDSYNAFWYYNGDMYSAVTKTAMTPDGQTTLCIEPIQKNLYEPQTEGEIVKVPIGQQYSGVNTSDDVNVDTNLYIRITDPVKNTFTYITKTEYEEYLKNTYKAIDVNASSYVPGKYYIYRYYTSTSTGQQVKEYALDKAYNFIDANPMKNELGTGICTDTEDFPNHVDFNNLPLDDTIPDSEVYYVFVPEDGGPDKDDSGKGGFFAPLGKLKKSYFRYVSATDNQTWESWWKEKPERESILKFSLNIANINDVQYYYKNTYMRYGAAQYFLPYDQIYNEITSKVTDYTYQKDSFYFISGLGDKEAVKLFANYTLDTGTSFTQGRRYFEKGFNNDVYIIDDTAYFTKGIGEEGTVGTAAEQRDVTRLNRCYRVRRGQKHNTNEYEELWIYKNETWKKLLNGVEYDNEHHVNKWAATEDITYVTNMAIDRSTYSTARGYDSTVWQKVFSEGQEKYVMVAELNSVVPTFEISADAPTVSPLVPHWDADSTNVYYKLHWQPQWGFRIKAADYSLKEPTYLQNGIKSSGLANLRRQPGDDVGDTNNAIHTVDPIYYPSDETVKYLNRNYNLASNTFTEGYYSSETQSWDALVDDEGTDIPAAIYYNKKGFDPNKISYSTDLLDITKPNFSPYVARSGWESKDSISITATGQSGHLYNTHGNKLDQEPWEDTQEFSLMLPSLGDSISKIWDIVFGGRETNAQIANSNQRNTDIEWESAKKFLDRKGLRLVHDDNANGVKNSYSESEINTIAGAINSAHDIMGMIIDSNSLGLDFTDPSDLKDDVIYFNSEDGQYYRRHVAYNYTPITDNIGYKKASVVEDDFDASLYYIKSGSNYVKVAEDATFDPDQTYYVDYNDVYIPVTFDEFDGTIHYYLEYTETDYDKDVLANLNKMSFILNDEYIPGNDYYTIDLDKVHEKELTNTYQPGMYYYYEGNTYVLDRSEVADINKQYYAINRDQIITVLSNPMAGSFDDIYVPGYYYYEDANGAIVRDDDSLMTPGRKYFFPNIKEEEDASEDNPDYTDTKKWKEVVTTKLAAPETKEEYDSNQQSAVFAGKESFYFTMNPDTLALIPYTETWEVYQENHPTLYYQSVQYVEYQDEQKFTIENLEKVNLTQFEDGAFFFPNMSPKGELLGWSKVTRDQVIPGSGVVYYAFCYGVEQVETDGPVNEQPKEWGSLTYRFSLQNGFKADDVPEYAVKTLPDFYIPNYYHYKTDNGSLILDTYKNMTHEKYYEIDEDAVTKKDFFFYEPNRYYFKGDDLNYYISTTEYDPSVQYYDRKQIHVIEDTRGILRPGTVWPACATEVPEGVTLGTREQFYEMKVIPGFARDVNTMHGLLLKINNFLEFEDEHTRKPNVVSGIVNQLKDLLTNIGELKPKTLTSIDNYGRITETQWDTRQNTTATTTKNSSKSLLKGIEGDVFPQANSVDDMRKQWLTINLDGDPTGPTLTVKHNFQPVKDTTVAGTISNNSFSTWEPIVDAMGHVVGKQNVSFVLPYSFKTFAIATQSDLKTNPTANTTSVVADQVEDTFTYASGNKWIRISGNATNDTITIGHEVHTFASGTANTDYGLSADMTTAQVDAENKFSVPVFQFDEAGHITSAATHTVSLPDVFAKVNTTVDTTDNKDSLAGTASAILAASMSDDFTIAEGNKWINIVSDNSSQILTISHYVKGFSETTGTAVDFNTSGTTFDIKTPTWDRAGHLTGVTKVTHTLPNGYKTITISNSGSAAVTESTNATATIAAGTPIDTFTIDSSNRWITLQGDASNKKVIIGHGKAGAASTSKGDTTAQTPNFGSSFKVLSIGIDAVGHVASVNAHNVTIPKPSLARSGNDGNLVTGLNLTDTTGAFTYTKANVGTLALTGYTAPSNASTTAVAATDTINSAFNKVEAHLKQADSDIDNKYDSSSSFTYSKTGVSATAPSTITIANLIKRVAYLEDRIKTLESASS